jgi:hypothetical protein
MTDNKYNPTSRTTPAWLICHARGLGQRKALVYPQPGKHLTTVDRQKAYTVHPDGSLRRGF